MAKNFHPDTKDITTTNNFEAITAIPKKNDNNTILSWTDKEEEERNNNIPESSWFEEKARPPVEYINYTNL
jgi:hypothetical protein